MIATKNDAPKRRDKLVIMAQILDISKAGALKTQIMYKANLSFSQLNEYLNRLAKTKLLEKTNNNGKDVYRATQKGVDFLERHQQIMCLLSENTVYRNAVRVPETFFSKI